MTPLILTLLLVLIVAVSALVGFARGFSKTVIRLMMLVLAIVLTFVLSAPITNLILDNIVIQGSSLGEFLLSQVNGKNAMLDGILESAPLLEEAIIIAPGFVIGFVIFPVVFLLLSFVSWLLFVILQKPLRRLFFKEKGKVKVGAGKRFAGFGIGAITGVLIFAMLMTPLFGLVSVLPEKNTLDNTVDILVEQGIIEENLGAVIKGELNVLESPIYTLPASMGLSPLGKTYLASVSKIERDGEVTYLTNEFDTLFAVAETAIKGNLVNAIMGMTGGESADMSALYTVLADEAFVKELIGDMFNSKLLRSAIPEVTAIALESTARMLGVPENDAEVYTNMMDDIATLVKDSDVDFEGIEAYEEAKNIYGADLMFADEQKTLLTDEEYEEEIKKLGDLEKKISKVVNKNVAGGSEALATGIAKGFVATVKEQVRAEGADSLKDFNPEKVQQKMTEIKPEDISVEGEDTAAVSDMLGKIQNPEKFETNVATVETVKESIRETVKEAVKDDSKSSETANTLASVVSNFAGAVSGASDENGNIDPMKLDFERVGNAVGALQGSTLNDVGSTVLDIVVSGDLGDNDMISSAVGGIKDVYNEGKPIADTVKTAGDVIKVVDAMNKSEGDNTTEALASSFEDLVKGLKESTIDILSDIITDEVMISMGVPEEHAGAAFSVLETLLRELVKLQGAADYDNEVNAVLSIYKIATSGVDKIKTEDIPELAKYAIDSDAIFNTLNSISTSNPFGIDIKTPETREDIANAIEENYAKSLETETDKQRVYDVYMSVTKLLGLEAEVELTK